MPGTAPLTPAALVPTGTCHVEAPASLLQLNTLERHQTPWLCRGTDLVGESNPGSCAATFLGRGA